MIMINKDNKFQFSENPFPAYRCELYFGRTKKDFEFLPVKDILPDEKGILPKNQFKIIKTKEKNTTLIINGFDNTERCLGFIGTKAGFRGSVYLLKDYSTANILKECHASNNTDGYFAVAALFNIGEKVVFKSTGRYGRYIIIHEFINDDIIETRMTEEEWESCQHSGESEEL